MYKINKRGQSTVEYVLLVAAVIAVMIAFATNQNSGGFQATLNTTLGSASDQMSNMADRLAGSEKGTNGASAASTYSVNVEKE
jgi:Flp pilus assembly pilin Flp